MRRPRRLLRPLSVLLLLLAGASASPAGRYYELQPHSLAGTDFASITLKLMGTAAFPLPADAEALAADVAAVLEAGRPRLAVASYVLHNASEIGAATAGLVLRAPGAGASALAPNLQQLLLRLIFEDYRKLPYADERPVAAPRFELAVHAPPSTRGCASAATTTGGAARYAQYDVKLQRARGACAPALGGGACGMECRRRLYALRQDACYQGSAERAAMDAAWRGSCEAAHVGDAELAVRDFFVDSDVNFSGLLEWSEVECSGLPVTEAQFASAAAGAAASGGGGASLSEDAFVAAFPRLHLLGSLRSAASARVPLPMQGDNACSFDGQPCT